MESEKTLIVKKGLKNLTWPLLTAACWAETVKITMVTNFTSWATELNLCGIPEYFTFLYQRKVTTCSKYHHVFLSTT